MTYVMLLAVHGVLAMQFMEFFFGVATATEIAYYSYIYSVVEPAEYQRVTGYCRSATLVGSAVGSLAGQVLVSVGQVRLIYLSGITLAAAALGSLAPWFLPIASRSLFFHQRLKGLGEGAAGERDGEVAVRLMAPADRPVAHWGVEPGAGVGVSLCLYVRLHATLVQIQLGLDFFFFFLMS